MLDYHVHLWPHPERADPRDLTVERLGQYCERAAEAGVGEIALTEHLFRFRRGREVIDGFWDDEPNERLRSYMARYFDHHATADLDLYMETVDAAKQAGLPVVAGLEVDYYPGQMEKVSGLLDGYPFDVLLGSIHWLGTWMFDIVSSPEQMDEWDVRGDAATWRAYAEAIEELSVTGACDVLAHPDLVKVTGRPAPAAVVDEVEERIAEAAARSGLAAEISSAGLHKPVGEAYPSTSLLDRFRRLGVPITTASDSHGIARVADAAPHLHSMAVAAGYTELRAWRGRTGYDVPLGPCPGPPGPPGTATQPAPPGRPIGLPLPDPPAEFT
jgi:histidinol-phosphatase (PHP family)